MQFLQESEENSMTSEIVQDWHNVLSLSDFGDRDMIPVKIAKLLNARFIRGGLMLNQALRLVPPFVRR